jgi:hypothetical protein
MAFTRETGTEAARGQPPQAVSKNSKKERIFRALK